MGYLLSSPAQPYPGLSTPHLLKTERGDAQRDPRGELGEEDVEGEEDGFGPVGLGMLQVEVINDIGQHGPAERVQL